MQTVSSLCLSSVHMCVIRHKSRVTLQAQRSTIIFWAEIWMQVYSHVVISPHFSTQVADNEVLLPVPGKLTKVKSTTRKNKTRTVLYDTLFLNSYEERCAPFYLPHLVMLIRLLLLRKSQHVTTNSDVILVTWNSYRPSTVLVNNRKKYTTLKTFYYSYPDKVSRGSSSQYSVWLRTGRPRFDPRQRRKDFSSILCVQTGSGAHPASCTMRTRGPFPGSKARPGRDADHSPPSSAEVENE
jgi:hypothetical protein